MATHALKRTVQDMGKTVQRSMAALAAKQEQILGLVDQIGTLRDAALVRYCLCRQPPKAGLLHGDCHSH